MVRIPTVKSLSPENAPTAMQKVVEMYNKGNLIPNTWDIHTHGVSQGILSLFMLCPQKAHWKVQRGLELKSGITMGAMEFGDFFHRNLDYIYGLLQNGSINAEQLSDELDSIVNASVNLHYEDDKDRLNEGLAQPSSFSELEILVGSCRTMLCMYFRRWMDDFTELNWVDLEKVFESPYAMFGYGDPAPIVPLRGKYDGVFRDSENHLWLFETKTKSKVDDPSVGDRLNFDLQTMFYLYTIQTVYGERPKGVVYNIVKRPQLRIKVNETLPQFFDRIEGDVFAKQDEYFTRYKARIMADELDHWANNDLASMMKQIYEWSQGKFNYRNSNACNQWNRPCEYLKACAYGDVSLLRIRPQLFPELATDLTVPQ